jgi:dipeptidyl aminopeptidase/acylaminoacyl peptidase
MKTGVSISPRDHAWYVRVTFVTLVALLPLALLAQGSGQSAQATRTQPAAQSGANWADEIINKEGYATPPAELASAVLAPRHLNVSLNTLSPDKKWFLNEIGDGPTSIAVYSRPFDELGGVFIDFKANRARTLTLRSSVGIQLVSAADGSKKPVAVPPNTRVSGARFTPDGAAVAYLAHTDDATHIWMTDIAANKPRQITKTPLLATLVTNFEFVNNGKQIAIVTSPDGRAARPAPPAAATGPQIRISEGDDRNRLRTFPSLMTTPYEFTLLEYHATGQIALIDVQSLAVTKFGKPAMIRAVDMGPDGKHARVTRMTKPFSYIVPTNSFGQIEEVWDAAGTALTKIAERPINLGVQADPADPPDPNNPPAQGQGGGGRGGGDNQQGKRDLTWRPDGTLVYLEQEPAPAGAGGRGAGRAAGGGGGGGGRAGADQAGGEQNQGQGRGQQAAQRKDRLMSWAPPFSDSSTKQIYEHPTRMTGLRFSPDGQVIFFSETANGATSQLAVYLNDPAQKYVLAKNAGGGGGRGGRGGGGDTPLPDPTGTLVGVGGAGDGGGRGGGGGGGRGGGGGGGGPVLLSKDGSSVFFQGTVNDRNPQQVGPKTFIDQVAIKTGAKTRIFESDNNGVWERVSTILDPDAKKFIITKEGAQTVPQQFVMENGARKQLTNNEDLHPDLTKMVIERFTATRPDGKTFRVTVNLPHDYQKGTRLPAFFWFYPREYTTQEAYDAPDRTFNKNQFQNFGSLSKEYFVRLGYAVVENDAPIFGPQGMMNNNYVHDLRTNLSVTIDELDRRTLVDRNRLSIGGHSYGAFSTVNAMVHTPFFRAGIAGDGAYNRTLTPLGFQTERRDLWEAPNVYLGMSPFLSANNLTGALLMYHGLHDQNVGTDPINSIRLFHALNGLGKTVALYMYPHEDHGPAAKETQLDLWARWGAWLDKYVKNPQPVNKPAPAPGGGGNGRGGRN